MQDTLPGFEPPEQGPRTEDDWLAKRIEISELFSPTHPVRETDLFAGRGSQITRSVDGILQAGQHIIIYGDRGVGKTSLINVVTQKVFANTSRVKFLQARCFEDDDFVSIWERAFKNHKWANGDYAIDDIDSTLDSDMLLALAAKFGRNTWPVFVFDEFDRIDDEETKLRMAETIKLLSDQSIESTIVVAGVGRTVRDLLTGHASISRAVRQIEMPRMSDAEIREIVNVRLARVKMTIDEDALDTIPWLACGMPAYAHLLGLHAARAALDRKTLKIDFTALMESLTVCLEEVGESTRHAYAKATRSTQPNNFHRQTLLACAMAPQDDELRSFTAASLRHPLTRIMGRARDIPDFNRQLNALLNEDRGPILEREGTPKNYHYRFIDPMMRSYVIMRGMKDGLLTPPKIE